MMKLPQWTSGKSFEAKPNRLARRFDDGWRTWLAENLAQGAQPDSLLGILTAQGFGAADVREEIAQARASPYFRVAEKLAKRLAKRDWVLDTRCKLARARPDWQRVERRHRLSRVEFLDSYYANNRPVVITGMMDDWPAMKKWNLDYFEKNFGDRVVEVMTGRNSDDNYEIGRDKHLTKMKFSEFIEMVRKAGVTNDFYMMANNHSVNRGALDALWSDIGQLPEYLKADTPMGYFWIGPAGTITPFHHDLTNNFMAMVTGRKRVKLVPSWDTPFMQNHMSYFSKLDGRPLTPTPNPAFGERQVVECVLGPGEILFLPIGWWHFVEGLDMAFMVSFTNFCIDNDFTTFFNTYHEV